MCDSKQPIQVLSSYKKAMLVLHRSLALQTVAIGKQDSISHNQTAHVTQGKKTRVHEGEAEAVRGQYTSVTFTVSHKGRQVAARGLQRRR